MKAVKSRFRSLYWRQMQVTISMVLLTLGLLGASFFALSYNYARNQKTEEIENKARIMGQLSVSYLEAGRFLSLEELQSDPGFRQLASFAATVSDVDFMICDLNGQVLLSTDESLAGQVVTMPTEMTREIIRGGESSVMSDLDGLYEQKQFVVGTPAVNPASQETVGVVFAVSADSALRALWQGFIGLVYMTALVVLMVAFMVPTAITYPTVAQMFMEADLIQTLIPQIVPCLCNAFGIFLLRQNFMQVPEELLESARLDEASELQIITKIMLPMAKATIVNIMMLSMMGTWNSYFWPLVMTYHDEVRPITIAIQSMKDMEGGLQWPIIMAGNCILVLPVLVLFLAASKKIIAAMAYRGVK